MENEKVLESKHDDVKKSNFFIKPERIQDMTDGVFAFAMTLLIVGIEFATPSSKITDGELRQNLFVMFPTFYKFILSFFLIAVFWITHHKQFQYIKKSNDGLLWLNIFLLLFIVFIPLTTDIMDDYYYLKTGMFVFNMNILLIGLLFYAQWTYAMKHNLLDERLTEEHKRFGLQKNSITWVVALVAMFAGFYNTELSGYIYLTIPLFIILLERSRKYKDL